MSFSKKRIAGAARRASSRRPAARRRCSRRPFVRRVSAALAALLAVAPLTACTRSMESSDITGPTITIGIAYDRPGVSLEHSGNMSGVDVDVATYVANRLGYSADQISWREASNADRDDLLSRGDVNMIVGVHQDLNGTTDDIEFSQSYVTMGQDLLVRDLDSESITSLADMAGKTVCVVNGYLEQEINDAIQTYGVNTIDAKNYSECMTALLSGGADAVEGDDMVLAGLAANLPSGSAHLVGNPSVDVEWGIALPQGDGKLRDNVNSALQRMVDDGTWSASVSAHFGSSSYSVRGAITPSA